MQLLALSTVYCLSILIVPSPHEPANLASTLRHRTQKNEEGTNIRQYRVHYAHLYSLFI